MSTRKTDLKEVLFPVELAPIYIPSRKPPQAPPTMQHVAEFSAVLDVESRRVFSVVTQDYRLVTNWEAITMGQECLRTVFAGIKSDSMKVYDIKMPKTRSYCHVDFIHEGVVFRPWPSDEWFPFLRVTNSYNKTMPLRFDLGFCRGACSNGIIFKKQSITFKFVHSKGSIGKTVVFQVPTELQQLQTQFIDQLYGLQRYHVPRRYMLALLCRALEIKFDLSKVSSRRRTNLLDFRQHVQDLTRIYFNEMGENAYAALNVISDFATRPRLFISAEGAIDRLQKRSGDWILDFAESISAGKFEWSHYLGEYLPMAERLLGQEQADPVS